MSVVDFEVDTLLSALAPTVRPGRLLTGGWRLVDAVFVRDDTISLRLESRRGGGLEIWISPREEERPAFARTEHFNLNYRRPRQRGADPVVKDGGARATIELVVRALGRADSAERRWRFPELPAVDREPGLSILTVSLPSPCGLRCTFCGIEVEAQIAALTLAELHSELHQGREQGARLLNLTGTEPLAHPHALDLVREAVRLGYQEIQISTAGLPLADRSFSEALREALPARYELSLPILAGEADLHDALTRTPGSFEQLGRALEVAREVFEPGQIKLIAVVLRQNLEALPELRQFVDSLGLELRLQLPFPDRSEAGSRYESVAVRLSEVVEAIYRTGSELVLEEVHPCLLLRHELATGQAAYSGRPGITGRLVGRSEVASEALLSRGGAGFEGAPSVACTERAACVLSGHCSQAVYRAYAELFGLEEFRAVTEDELGRLSP